MSRPGWDEWGLGIAKAVSTRGDCTRRQVGAVILDADHRPVSFGYNGAAPGAPGCLTDGACPRGTADYSQIAAMTDYNDPSSPGFCISIHGEVSAILHANWQGMKGATLYVTDEPCMGCRKTILGTGIVRVVWPSGEWCPQTDPIHPALGVDAQ